MKYKILLFSLLSFFNYSAYSMEAVSEPEEVQEISRCERKFKEIIDELKALNAENNRLNLDEFACVVKRILKNILLENSLEEQCYQRLNEAMLDIVLLNDPSEKINKYIAMVGELFALTLMRLTNINNHSRAEVLDLCIIKKLIMKLSSQGIDLIDIWLEYVRENKTKQFKSDFLTIDLEEDIYTYIDDNDIINLTKLIETKYTDFIHLDLLNKKLDSRARQRLIHGELILVWLIGISPNGNLSGNLNNLIYKLINEPKLLTSNLCLIKQRIIELVDQYTRLPRENVFARIFPNGWHNYLKAINFRLGKIDNSKAKLFDAINSQDENGNSNIDLALIRRRAYELYSITRDFQNSNGDTPLHIAVLLKNKKLIATLISIYPELLDIENNDGRTPISLAAGDIEMLKLIFDIANMCKLRVKPEYQFQEQSPSFEEQKDFVLSDCAIL